MRDLLFTVAMEVIRGELQVSRTLQQASASPRQVSKVASWKQEHYKHCDAVLLTLPSLQTFTWFPIPWYEFGD